MIAVDFETFYSSKHTVSDKGPWAYAHHPDTDIYLAAIKGEGIDFVGDPAAFDWNRLDGRDLVSHNAGFDSVVAMAGVKRGIMSRFAPRSWSCSADLMAYEGYPRALADAAQASFGEKVSKLMRNWMSGKHWSDAVAKGKDKELAEYAGRDSDYCLRLWEKHSPNWPTHERVLSAHTRSLIHRGVPVDQPLLAAGIAKLQAIKDDAEKLIPWRGGKILSLENLREHCRALGVRPPSSLAKDSEECAAWEDRYGPKFPWIAALRDYRRTNMLLKKLESMQLRIREDGTIPVYLKYFGGHTGRWSGDAGVNFQNMPRGEMYGVDMRKMIVPGEGNKFVIWDLSQIEARVLLWLVGDTDMLDALRAGHGLYETHARQTMGWTGGPLKKEDPAQYQLAKARVLGLGFGCGPSKFQYVAKVMAGLDLSEDECQKTVYQWRDSNPKVPALWRKLTNRLTFARDQRKDVLTFELPSGRMVKWWQPRPDPEETSDTIINQVNGAHPVHTWGGSMTENIVQALAREIFADAMLRVERAGIPVAWHIHDEMVARVPSDAADDANEEMGRILATPPEWIKDIPLGAEGGIFDYYTK